MTRSATDPLLVLALAAALLGCGGSARPKHPGSPPATAAQAAAPLPDPDAFISGDPATVSADLTDTTRRLRAAIDVWTATNSKPVPQDVELLALHHQRIYRRIAGHKTLERQVLKLLPADIVDEARDTLAAKDALAAIPSGKGGSAKPPKLKIAPPPSPQLLRAAYDRAERRFGVHWETLAAINFVESAFGRVTSASSAGARGPMQFIPATWAAYGLGGNINKSADAILGAANYLHASGAPRDIRGALYHYNQSTSYGEAVIRFAHHMRADPRAFRIYYAWQVYSLTSSGVKRLSGPGL